MENQDHMTSATSQSTPSREELEQQIRMRAWKDDTFRQEFQATPKAVLERDYAQYFFEGKIPSELSIKVIEEEEQTICFVLPPKLADDQLPGVEDIDDQELSMVTGGYSTPLCKEITEYCVSRTGCITCNSCRCRFL